MSTVPRYSSANTALPWAEDVTLLDDATHARVVEFYFAIWAFLMPLATFVVIPRIPGTIPAYLLAFASPIFCLRRKYFAALICFFLAWAVFTVTSQLGLLHSGSRAHMTLFLVNNLDREPVFRSTLITQSLYLFACVLIFLFVRTHYKQPMMRYVFWGAWFFVLYGLYDWAFQLATGTSGDFLNNRTFDLGASDTRAASWSQYVTQGHFRFLRLKGMTEEPSRYGTIAVVYASLAITHGRRWLTLVLLLTLFLSTSLTGFLGLAVMLVMFYLFDSPAFPKRSLVAITVLVIVAIFAAAVVLPDLFDETIMSRLRGEHRSAQIRSAHLTDPLSVFWELPWVNKFFGVGVGTCFLPGANNMLINFGLLGLLAAVTLFAYPMMKLRKSREDIGVIVALGVLAFIYAFISSGIFVPILWMLLGIAYARAGELSEQARNGRSNAAY